MPDRSKEEELLEDWLFDHPEEFEEGIRWVKRQYDVYWRGEKIGRIDLLGVDKDKNIIIVELKAVSLNHKDYSQGLCYYRSLSSQQPKSVRLLLVGPSMSTRFRIVHELMQETSSIDVGVKLYNKIGLDYELRDYNRDTEGHIFIPHQEDNEE